MAVCAASCAANAFSYAFDASSAMIASAAVRASAVLPSLNDFNIACSFGVPLTVALPAGTLRVASGYLVDTVAASGFSAA